MFPGNFKPEYYQFPRGPSILPIKWYVAKGRSHEKKLLFSWILSKLTCINVHFVAKMLQSRDVLSAFSLLSPLLDAQHPYVLKARNIVHCLHRQKYLKYCTCPKFCKPYAASTCSTGWEFCIRILPPQAVNITLPKAQQTRGLSSVYQNNLY